MTEVHTMTNEARRLLDNAMSEAALMQAIVECAELHGFLVLHIPDKLYKLAMKEGRMDAMGGAKGFPDLVLLHGSGSTMLVLETKTVRGETTAEQDAFLDAFSRSADAIAGHPVAVMIVRTVRPADLDYILKVIKFYGERERMTA